MPENGQSSGWSVEGLMVVINQLRDHEIQTDQLISRLSTIFSRARENANALSGILERISEKLATLQIEIEKLKGVASAIQSGAQTLERNKSIQAEQVASESDPLSVQSFKNFESFQKAAAHPDSVAFFHEPNTNVLRVEALKGRKAVTYLGEAPSVPTLLTVWLSQQLQTNRVRELPSKQGVNCAEQN
ncbi:MAG: hypothetical protein ACE14S_03805 [Candidatus Bathyarchaeia archaeon]